MLPDQTVPLQRSELRPDRIVRDAEGAGHLLHRKATTAEQADESTPGTLAEPALPVGQKSSIELGT
jgi:hypothetical protein